MITLTNNNYHNMSRKLVEIKKLKRINRQKNRQEIFFAESLLDGCDDNRIITMKTFLATKSIFIMFKYLMINVVLYSYLEAFFLF